MEGLCQWRFDGGGGLQLYEKAEHAGHGSVTLMVDDIDALRLRLAEAGQGPTKDMDSDVTTISILEDPDGNQLVFSKPKA